MEQEFLRDFMARLRADDGLFGNFVLSARAGTNKAFMSMKNETLVTDETWVYNIEGVLFCIEKIARDPRKFIAENEMIVDAERARKTNAKTVRHLASHSANVREIKTDGEVIPKRVLTVELEEDVAIYENRFIGTLVHRLVNFVEQRYNDLTKQFQVLDETGLNVKSEFKYGEADVSYEMNVVIKAPPENQDYMQKVRDLLEKIEDIRKRLRILTATPFMRLIDKAKPVRPPIQKTNLLRMQQDYRNCYQLWLYVSAYTSLGYSIDVIDKTLPIDGDYFDDLTVLTAMSVKSMAENNLINKDVYDKIPFSDPQRKNYKNLTKYDFQTDFKFDKDVANVDDSINEYYFQQIKRAFTKESKQPQTDDPALQEKELRMSFMRYFNTVTSVNNSLFFELIKKQSPRAAGRTPLQRKEAAVQQQEVLVRRLRQLNRLKTMDLDKTAKMEKRELTKLEQAKAQVVKEKEREEKAKLLAQRARERMEAQREKERMQKVAEQKRKTEEAARQAELKRRAKAEAERKRKEAILQKEKERKDAAKAKDRARINAAKEREKQKIAAQKAREKARAAAKKTGTKLQPSMAERAMQAQREQDAREPVDEVELDAAATLDKDTDTEN